MLLLINTANAMTLLQAKNSDGLYFAGWQETPWAAVPRIAIFSPIRKEAAWMRPDEVMDLVIGYGKLITRSKE